MWLNVFAVKRGLNELCKNPLMPFLFSYTQVCELKKVSSHAFLGLLLTPLINDIFPIFTGLTFRKKWSKNIHDFPVINCSPKFVFIHSSQSREMVVSKIDMCKSFPHFHIRDLNQIWIKSRSQYGSTIDLPQKVNPQSKTTKTKKSIIFWEFVAAQHASNYLPVNGERENFFVFL